MQHEDDAPPALLGEWLRGAGADLDVRRCHRGDPLPTTLVDHAALLVLGGEMGAYDDTAHPWLTPTKRLAREAAAAGTPLLGICLGHQLAAVALGGRVAPHPTGRQIGVFDVGWTAAARTDPVFGGLAAGAASGEAVPAVQWNDDVVTDLPPGGTVLARTPDGALQAARFGPSAWGLQPHPEADRALVARWAQTDPSALAALDAIG
ncbi:MAG: type 1 glutamine amidotransferase, partial [Nocardioidaceae bacterium]|nr:type 1 glutamine amidotransferase [Nocardioidaceae bacterium]